MHSLGNITAVFIDDGDVMSDNTLREKQWRRLIGEFFVPRLGGDYTSWAEANRAVFTDLWEMVSAGPGDEPFKQWWDRYQAQWMRGMADRVGVSAPEPDAECTVLAREVSEFVTKNVRSAYPGAIDAIKTMSDRGLQLFTASNEVSWELNGYLTGMGVRNRFISLYGPDLVDADKHSDHYYSRIFEDAGVNPSNAVVIDNWAEYLDRAAATGATTFQVSEDSSLQASSVHTVLASLSELPGAIQEIGR